MPADFVASAEMTAIGLGPQRRTRRSAAAIEAIETAIFETLKTDHPQTLRGLFYQLVTSGARGA